MDARSLPEQTEMVDLSMQELSQIGSLSETPLPCKKLMPIRLLKRPQGRIRVRKMGKVLGNEAVCNRTVDCERKHDPSSPPRETTTPVTGLRDRIRFLESRETPAFDPAIPSHLGLLGKLNYMESYRNLSRIRDTRSHYHLPKCPMAEFQSQVDHDNLSPEPVGVIRRRGVEEEMNLAKYGIGDRYALALSKGIKCLPKLTKLNMSCNRLSDKGAGLILANLNPSSTKTLDLSYNTLSKQTIDNLSLLCEQPLFRLEVLHLEGNKLRDRGLVQLLKALGDTDSLEDLNLAKTGMGDVGAEAVGAFLKDVKKLRKLDLHWNLIRSLGGVALFKGLADNSGIRILDVSWNALGHPCGPPIGSCISSAFLKHPDLFHVDLSHNQLTESDCEAVNRGLSKNHSIAGIHMQGNEARVDALGFVNAMEGCSVPAEAHVFVRILGESKVGGGIAWRPTNNCWLCEGWSEIEFSYISSSLNVPIYLHLSFENYQPYLLKDSEEGVYTENRMCPPGEVRFFFTEIVTPRLDPSCKKVKLAVPITGPFVYGQSQPISIYTDEVNSIMVAKSINFLKAMKARPRPMQRRFSPDGNKAVWSIANSVFREYRFEDEDLLSKCFDFDWDHSKLPKVIKDSEDCKSIKSLLWRYYKGIRETYKYYACFSPQGPVFCISQNAFAEFCTKANLTNGMKISDLDFQFKATNYSEVKNNPRNPANALIRCQFMEILVRIAIDKYVKSGNEKKATPALERLYNEYFKDFFDLYDSNRWRWSRYLNESCDQVLKTYLPLLQIVYNTNSRLQVKPGQKAFMCLTEFQFICTAAGLLNDHFTTRDIDFCYGLSMMTQIDEINSERHYQMSLVEFLEALGRVADIGQYAGEGKVAAEALKVVMEKLLALCPRPVRERFKQGRDSNDGFQSLL